MGREGGAVPLISIPETACMAVIYLFKGGTRQSCVSVGGSILLHHIGPVNHLLAQAVSIQWALSVR